MSYRVYEQARKIESGENRDEPEFYAIIMAAMRRADTDNLDKLKAAWPTVWEELQLRYNAPAGFLSEAEAISIGGHTKDEIASIVWHTEGYPYEGY